MKTILVIEDERSIADTVNPPGETPDRIFGARPFFQALADSFQAQCAGKEIWLEMDIPEAMMLEGDTFLLRGAVPT